MGAPTVAGPPSPRLCLGAHHFCLCVGPTRLTKPPPRLLIDGSMNKITGGGGTVVFNACKYIFFFKKKGKGNWDRAYLHALDLDLESLHCLPILLRLAQIFSLTLLCCTSLY